MSAREGDVWVGKMGRMGIEGGGKGGGKRGEGNTFGGITGFILAEPGEVFVFEPGDVGGVVFVVFLAGPFRHFLCGFSSLAFFGGGRASSSGCFVGQRERLEVIEESLMRWIGV